MNILSNDFPAPVSHPPLTLDYVKDLRGIFRRFMSPSPFSSYCAIVELHTAIERQVSQCSTDDDLVYRMLFVPFMDTHAGRQFLIQLPANEPSEYQESLSAHTLHFFRPLYWNILKALAILAQKSFEFKPVFGEIRAKSDDVRALAPMFLEET